MKGYGVLALVLLVSAAVVSGCASPTTSGGYTVLFDGKPQLFDTGVYANGMAIGQIADTVAGTGGVVCLTVTIDETHRPLMTRNAVFYVSAGRLNYATVEAFGEAVSGETPILGFNSRFSLTLFRLKTLLGSPSAKAARLAGALAARR